MPVVRERDREWFAYIDAEVRAVCEAKGWGSQIRRKWSAREKPVSKSRIGDYEWKLHPGAHGRLADAPEDDFEGVYYVVCFDDRDDTLVLQHDTHHAGAWGPHWEVSHFTKIACSPMSGRGSAPGHPPGGWLASHLFRLASRLGPNHFSIT